MQNSKKVELALYLRELLYNTEEVIIPGLGTLFTKYRPAQIQHAERIISPPSKYLDFDETRTGPDSMLYEFYSNSNPENGKDAVEEVTAMINEVIDKLNSGETVLLEGIGYFSKIEEKIRFEKLPEYNYLTDTYGLSTINYEPVENSFPQHNADNQVYIPHKSHTTLYLFLILIILVGGGILVYLNFPDISAFFKGNKTTQIKPVIKPDNSTTEVDTTSTNKKLEKFFDSTTNKKNALAIENTPAPENAKYYIIAGSFKTIEKANKLSKEMETEGYKNEVIQFDNKIFRISLGTYTDKNKAVEDLLKIRFVKGDNAVWLLTQKDKK